MPHKAIANNPALHSLTALALLFFCIFLFFIPAATKAQGTATSNYISNTEGTFTAGSVNVSVTVDNFSSNMNSTTSGVLNSVMSDATNFPGSWYSTSLVSEDFRRFLAQRRTGGQTVGTMRVTYTFDRPVTNPVLHFANLDAGTYNFNATTTSTGGSVSMTRLSGNNTFEFSGTSINTVPGSAVSGGCEDNNGGNGFGACGSVRFNGTYTQLIATITSTAGNDGHGVALSILGDFGDAPASYGVAGHNHVGASNPIMGNSTFDIEYATSTPSDDATGSDDETLTTPALTQGNTTTFSVPIIHGANKYLNAWFDWNGDGDFADSGEHVADDIMDGGAGDSNPAAGMIAFSITPPLNATTSATWARLRISSANNIAAASLVYDGEVEDHPIAIAANAILAVAKNSAPYNDGVNPVYNLPGHDVLYSITVTNTAAGITTPNTVFILDPLPSQVTFFNGDANGSAAGTDPVYFTNASSGLTFNYATDVRYATGSTTPANFAACTYSPLVGYDPAVRYICINPKGAMNGILVTPTPQFSVNFRTRIN